MFRVRNALAAVVALAAIAVAWLQPWVHHGADAQKLPTTVAAVIDYQRILRDAAAARAFGSRSRRGGSRTRKRSARRSNACTKPTRRSQAALGAQPEAFAEKRRAFEQEVAEVQRLVQERRRELDSMAAAALNEVKEALIEIVTSIAEERGFNLVLPNSEVLFFSRSLDLTEEVLAKLDARLPQVQLSEVSAGD